MNARASIATPRRCSLFACVAMLLSFPVAAAQPQRVLALLVGVSTYPALPAPLQLQDGPANDVQLFANYLRQRGIANTDISLLSDTLPGAAAPTRREILAGLSRLSAQARPGDTVILMFSGHGSQQPSRQDARIEPDGLDQIFLPLDAGRWDGAPRQVQNAITDDEIGNALALLRARGAFVWAIFDTCHAGTLTRGLLGSTGTRFVAPEQLGVPAGELRAAREQAATRLRTASTARQSPQRFEASNPAAGYVAFFASQREEIAGQVQVRQGRSTSSYGRFTWTLVQALQAQPAASYRQVMETVLMNYREAGVVETTPTQEGTALDASVLGDTAERVAQWPVRARDGLLRMEAGQLQGVTTGSVVSLVAGPAAAASEILGYARVQQSAPADAVLQPIEYSGRPAPDSGNFRGMLYARPVDMVEPVLRVSKPRKDAACENPNTLLEDAIATLRQRAPPRIQWVEAGEVADVRLCQQQGKLVFLEVTGASSPGDEALASVSDPSLMPRGMTAATLADGIASTLLRIAGVQDLYRIAARHRGAEQLLEAAVQLCRGAGTGTAPCARTETIATTSRPAVRSGDRLDITLRNRAWNPVHATVLYIDANLGIHTLFPDPAIPQEQARLPARSEAISIPVVLNADPAGFERVLVIAVAEQARDAPDTGIVELITQAIRGMVRRDNRHVAFDRSVEFTGFGWMVEPDQASEGLQHGR